LDYEQIEALVGVLRDSARLTELEVRQGGAVLRLRRPAPLGKSQARRSVAIPEGNAASNGGLAGASEALLETLPSIVTVIAHFVGVFRARRPQPLALGDQVTENQSLGHIEAMRLMNDCLAPTSGRIQAVLVQEGQPVEFGQALFEIVPGESP